MKKDRIYYMEYLDHATIRNENLDEVRANPFLLWCCGKIVNKQNNEPFYAVISDGAVNRYRKPSHIEIVIKSTITTIKCIYEPEPNN